jgi:hypothetical protein
MRRTLVTTLVVMLLSCLLVFAQADKSKGADKSTLLNIEKQLWKAWEQGDTKPFEQHLASNAMSIGSSGIMDSADLQRHAGRHLQRPEGPACSVGKQYLQERRRTVESLLAPGDSRHGRHGRRRDQEAAIASSD